MLKNHLTLTLLTAMSDFHTPLKMFSGVIEIGHWYEKGYSILYYWSLFTSLKHKKKPDCFRGERVKKETSGMKWVNEGQQVRNNSDLQGDKF